MEDIFDVILCRRMTTIME